MALYRPLVIATGDTTLFGEGERHGVEVRVPNQGDQWRPLYFSPPISMSRSWNSNAETVAQEASRVTAELDGALREASRGDGHSAQTKD